MPSLPAYSQVLRIRREIIAGTGLLDMVSLPEDITNATTNATGQKRGGHDTGSPIHCGRPAGCQLSSRAGQRGTRARPGL